MKISSGLLDTGLLYPLMQQTLQMYLRGEALLQSPVADWGRKTLAAGKWWYGVEKLPVEEREAGIRQRLDCIVGMFEAFKAHGYIGSEVTVKFDAEGNLWVHDGFHRLCIMRFLGIKANVNCRVQQDFPLEDTLRELNSGENLYQPTGDARTAGWNLWRTDCLERLNLVRHYLVDGSVLDGGCESGYFTRALSGLGFQVLGVDCNVRRVAVARYLAATQNVKCNFKAASWQNALQEDSYSNVLLLSVLHHDAIKRGIKFALGELAVLSGKCKRAIIEFPLESEGVYWLCGGGQRWSFNHQELAQTLEAITGMRAIAVLEGASVNRPLIVLEAV